MTPEQLRHLRESRGLTREQLADELKDCSASTVNKWERGMHAIPSWVEEKMLRKVPLEMPIDEIHALLNRAQEDGITFPELLARAIRSYLSTESAQPKPSAPTVKPGATPTPTQPAQAAASPSNITRLPAQHIAAETPAEYQFQPHSKQSS